MKKADLQAAVDAYHNSLKSGYITPFLRMIWTPKVAPGVQAIQVLISNLPEETNRELTLKEEIALAEIITQHHSIGDYLEQTEPTLESIFLRTLIKRLWGIPFNYLLTVHDFLKQVKELQKNGVLNETYFEIIRLVALAPQPWLLNHATTFLIELNSHAILNKKTARFALNYISFSFNLGANYLTECRLLKTLKEKRLLDKDTLKLLSYATRNNFAEIVAIILSLETLGILGYGLKKILGLIQQHGMGSSQIYCINAIINAWKSLLFWQNYNEETRDLIVEVAGISDTEKAKNLKEACDLLLMNGIFNPTTLRALVRPIPKLRSGSDAFDLSQAVKTLLELDKHQLLFCIEKIWNVNLKDSLNLLLFLHNNGVLDFENFPVITIECDRFKVCLEQCKKLKENSILNTKTAICVISPSVMQSERHLGSFVNALILLKSAGLLNDAFEHLEKYLTLTDWQSNPEWLPTRLERMQNCGILLASNLHKLRDCKNLDKLITESTRTLKRTYSSHNLFAKEMRVNTGESTAFHRMTRSRVAQN